MKKTSILAALLIFLSLSFAGLIAQNAHDLFQKALTKERAEGNLKEAISLYEKVIEVTRDESLAAQAQLRIGICYETLGMKEAEKAYQKVIDNYPKQAEAVEVAKGKLSILLRAQAALEKGEKGFQLRQVWTGKEVDGSGEISFDGKYLSFVDWDTGDLAIREMATGKNRHLTHKGSWDESIAFAMTSVWSPNEKQLAYIWENDAEKQVEVHIVGLDGSEPRLLYKVDYTKGWLEVAGTFWSFS